MKRFVLFAACCLAACQPSTSEPSAKSDELTAAAEQEVTQEETVTVKAGVVGLRLLTPVAEPFACIIPIRIENGLDASTRLTIIGFDITGPGEDSKGNMFAPTAEAGETSEARVIIEGQSCDAYDTISIPEMRCTSGENSCADKVELFDGGGLRFATAG